MYSAFSERSPSAAASASARTTSGRRTRQSSSSSSLRRRWPSAVMIAVDGAAADRQRLMLRCSGSRRRRDLVEKRAICRDIAGERVAREAFERLVEQPARDVVLAHALAEHSRSEQRIARHVAMARIRLEIRRHELQRDLRRTGVDGLLRDARDVVRAAELERGIDLETFARDVDGAPVVVLAEQD